MTTLEKDMREALEGNEKEVLLRRKAEIKRLTLEGKGCKNGFRRQCIANESETVADIAAMRGDIDRATALRLNPYLQPEEVDGILNQA